MSGCDCSGNAGLNGQSFNSYNQPMVSPMSDMGSFGSAEIYNSPSYGMGGNRNNDAYNIDLTGTQPQINYQMAQQQNQPPVRNNDNNNVITNPQMNHNNQGNQVNQANNQVNNQGNNQNNQGNNQVNNQNNQGNNQVQEKIVYVKQTDDNKQTNSCPSTGKMLSKYNIVFIVLLLTGLAWHEVIKYYINRSIKFSNGSHKYFIYYAGIATLALLFFISMNLK